MKLHLTTQYYKKAQKIIKLNLKYMKLPAASQNFIKLHETTRNHTILQRSAKTS